MSGLNLISVFLLLSCVVGVVSAQLSPNFYDNICPLALSTIKTSVDAAVALEPRMGASLLRLHFHDCFVQGCDASILLDDTVTFTGEKTATQNINSVRGFDVIDTIKSAVEAVCPGLVSCADIVAVAARDSVVALGGPSWSVQLGRRDSTTASLSLANSDLPSPSLNISDLITLFSNKGFSPQELVALSGAHTIGKARCVNFRTRIYTESNIDALFAATLQLTCPVLCGDDILSNLDTTILEVFDNSYYTNLVNKKGLLHSDQQLFSGGPTDAQVTIYNSNNATTFKADFGNAMIKLGNLSPLTGSDGQVRLNCRKVT